MLSRYRILRESLALAATFLGAGIASGERLFIGVLEADGYQSVLYGASAFSRVSDLPLALELVNNTLSETFLVPSFSCVSPSDTFRVVQTVDPSQPRGDNNPANVAILPISGTDTFVHSLYKSAYAVRRDVAPFTLYEQAQATNLQPRVFVALTGRHLLTSTSQDALQWAWDNRSRLIDAPSQSIPGTLRVLVNPQRLADVMGTYSGQADAFFKLDKLLRDFETFSFSLTLDGQALTLTACGKPKDKSPLDALSRALRPPLPALWNGLPDNAFFVSLSSCDSPLAWDTYLGSKSFRLFQPVSDAVTRGTFCGDHLLYLAATHDKRGLCWVRIDPVKTAAPAAEAIRHLHEGKSDDNVLLKREPSRKKGTLPIETYSISFSQPPSGVQDAKPAPEPSTLFTLMAIFLKQAVLETAVTNGYLVSVIGPPNAIDDQLDNLLFREKPISLKTKLLAKNSALSEKLCQAASLKMAALLRQIVTIMPGVKPEHLRAFPADGDGMTFGISVQEDLSLIASFQLQSSEIAALQRINRNGREVLQELVFQLFSNQMLHMQDAEKTSGHPSP